MTRKVTVTYDVPEDLCQVLEQKAATEGRRLEDVVAEHLARYHRSRPRPTPQEVERRKAAFERHLGAWDSGEANSSDNERIDADLAGEYAGRRERNE